MRYETQNYNTILFGETEAIAFLVISLLRMLGIVDVEVDLTVQHVNR
jgi:hypothetical protein